MLLKTEITAHEDLGHEAIHFFTAEMFPAVVIIDMHGHDFYQQAVEAYARV
ncbi:MAG: fumarate hydratase C-terminal domain-containing protein [Deltaproteobacteria bacterium]|nr:fumarate hydratase C-terminal domain-containing protein [Deltaproteobacteria bacterium]